jgi:hypothetical protein
MVQPAKNVETGGHAPAARNGARKTSAPSKTPGDSTSWSVDGYSDEVAAPLAQMRITARAGQFWVNCSLYTSGEIQN